MTVVHGGQDLTEEVTCFWLLDHSILDNVVKEFTPTRVFHHDEIMVLSLVDVRDTHDMGMAEKFHQADLSLYARLLFRRLDVDLFNDFDGGLLCGDSG